MQICGCLVPHREGGGGGGGFCPHSPHTGSKARARGRRCSSLLPTLGRMGGLGSNLLGWGEGAGAGGGRHLPGAWGSGPGCAGAAAGRGARLRGGAAGGKGAGGRRSGAVASHQEEDCSRHAQAPRRFCVREFCRRCDPCEGGRAARGERPRVTSAAGRIITTWPGHCFPLLPGSGGGAGGCGRGGAVFSRYLCPSLPLGKGRVGDAGEVTTVTTRASVSSLWNGGEVFPGLELRMSRSLRSGGGHWLERAVPGGG